MNELQLRTWLADEAPSATPDRLRVRVAAIPVDDATGWGALPALTMRRTTLRLLLVAAVVVALIAMALFVGAQLRKPFGGTSASITAFAWSPDGSQLAFSVGGRRDAGGTISSYDELYVAGADGAKPRLIDHVDRAGFPMPVMMSWSPDSRYAAFGSRVEDLAKGTSIDLAADGVTAVVAGWLAGDRVLFQLATPTSSDIFSIEPDGRDRKALSPEPGNAAVDAISPDGSRILYRAWSDSEEPSNTTYSGWVMSGDGSNKLQLSPSTQQLAWAEHGTRVYIWADAPYAAAAGVIESVKPDGTDRRVVQGPWQVYVYRVADDGRYVGNGVNGGIVTGMIGGPPRVITTDPGDGELSISPDGSWLAFIAERPDQGGIFIVPFDGGTPRLVASNVVEWSTGNDAVWQPRRSGIARFAFVRNGALHTIAADGSDLRTVVPRTAVSERVVEPPFDGTFDDRIIFGPNGPDRDVYHVPRRSELDFTIENQTDVEWEVMFGFSGGPAECTVASGNATPPQAQPVGPTDTQTCLVPPHAAVAVKANRAATSSQQVLARPLNGPASAAWWVVTFDFEPAPLRTSTTAP